MAMPVLQPMKKKRAHIRADDSEIDLGLLIPELLRALRGKASQGQINRRLGYSYAQVYRWEAGRKSLSFEDFAAFCQACRKGEALTVALRQGLGFRGEVSDTRLLLETLCGERTPAEIQAGLRCSRFQYSRWSSGKSKLPLETVLASALFFRRSLLLFLELLVPMSSLPSLAAAAAKRRKIIETFEEAPYTVALLKALESRQYHLADRHEEKILAELVGISLGELREALRRLLEAGLIEFRGGKYSAPTTSVSTIGDRAHRLRIHDHWFRRSQKKVAAMRKEPAGAAESVFSVRFVNLSRERYQHIVKNANHLYGAFMKLAEEPIEEPSGGRERTFVFQMHLMNLAEREGEF